MDSTKKPLYAHSKEGKFAAYLIGIAIPLTVGVLAAFLTRENMAIYEEIVVPPLAPPSWLFPVAWSILYILMGIGAARVFLAREKDLPTAKDALAFFGMNLTVNFAWSIFFFNFGVYLFAFFWLLFLLAIVVKMTVLFKKLDTAAAVLQIPYIAWLLFAGYLNLAIALLN